MSAAPEAHGGDPLKPVDRSAITGPPLEIAPLLLNAVLVAGPRRARIVEVEAYDGADDPASHAYRGQTARNRTMFEGPGLLYVYLSYGLHHCANITCREPGRAGAVLIRAVEPLNGLAEMRAGRPATLPDRHLGSGPGRACRSLGITLADDGADLCDPGGRLVLARDGAPPPPVPLSGPRVGLSGRSREALHWPWRFAVPGAAAVSRPLPPGSRHRPA